MTEAHNRQTERNGVLVAALRDAPCEQVNAERLRAAILLRQAEGRLPDFAQEVLPSSQLSVIWFSARTLWLGSLLLVALLALVRPWSSPQVHLTGPAQEQTKAPPQPTVEPLYRVTATSADASAAPQITALEPTRVTSHPHPKKITHKLPVRALSPAQVTAIYQGTGAETDAPAPADTSAPAANEANSQPVKVRDARDFEEMHHVAEAERLLLRNPADCLRLVRDDNQRFPDGYFVEERRYLEIMALVSMDQRDDARAFAKLFLRDYPRGPYGARIRRALKMDEN